jgi:hypothetical protein
MSLGASSGNEGMTAVGLAVPLFFGIIATVGTIATHGLAVLAILHFMRQQTARGRTGAMFWTDLCIVTTTALITVAAHLTDICVWAVLVFLTGEFGTFGTAVYHSAVNYTTLGYGDLVMSPAWRLLGPIEAMDGLLMFGITTAMLFAVIRWIIRTRYPDARV